MASRYWVPQNATLNWNTTGPTNWGSASGVADNSSVPGSSDDVFMDGNSGIGNSTVSANITVKSVNCTGYAGTLTRNNFILTVTTSLKYVTGMTYTGTGGTTFTAAGGTGNTIDTGGKTLRAIIFNASSDLGDWTLLSDITSNNTITFNRGIFSSGAFNVTADTISANNPSSMVINMGSGLWKSTGTSGVDKISFLGGSLTLNAQTSTLMISSITGTVTVQMGGHTLYNFTIIAATSIRTISLGAGFEVSNNFTIGAYNSVLFTAGETYTVNNFIINSTTKGIVTLFGSDPGSSDPWFLVGNGGAYNFNHLSITDSAATSGTWTAVNSIDGGGNTGWTITPPSAANSGDIFILCD